MQNHTLKLQNIKNWCTVANLWMISIMYVCVRLCYHWLCESVNSLDMQICVSPSQYSFMLCTFQTQPCHTGSSISFQRICSLFLPVSQTNLHLLTLLLTDRQILPEEGSKRWVKEKQRKKRGIKGDKYCFWSLSNTKKKWKSSSQQ